MNQNWKTLKNKTETFYYKFEEEKDILYFLISDLENCWIYSRTEEEIEKENFVILF
jgi:hypothetical protein